REEARGALPPAAQRGLLRSQSELTFEPSPPGGGQFGEGATDPVDPLGVGLERRKVRLGEVAVVERLLLGPQGMGGALPFVEVASLLNQRLARAERRDLPFLLVLHGSSDRRV